MSDELAALIEEARQWRSENPLTPAELRQQCISFAYGNVSMHNKDVTLSMIEEAYDILVARIAA